jgi:hypothetical protein
VKLPNQARTENSIFLSLSATCRYFISLVSFAAISLCVASYRVFIIFCALSATQYFRIADLKE